MSIFASVDADTADLLALIADAEHPAGRDVPALFLAACEADALGNGGFVSVNRVRTLLADADIPPRRYSSLWSHFTGRGKPMRKATENDRPAGAPDSWMPWDICSGSGSGNDGRPFTKRVWVGTTERTAA